VENKTPDHTRKKVAKAGTDTLIVYHIEEINNSIMTVSNDFENLRQREKLIMDSNKLLGKILELGEYGWPRYMGKVIKLKADLEKEILDNTEIYAPFFKNGYPPRRMIQRPKRRNRHGKVLTASQILRLHRASIGGR
jgi:hypothetical protein